MSEHPPADAASGTAPPGAATAAGGSFLARYRAAAERHRSLLCVGLDPDPARLPAGVDVETFLAGVIEATWDRVCCFKPNAAFFESAAGWALLGRLVARVPEPMPVLLDAKRGDIGNTAAFYAHAAFAELGAHAITANPYLGGDALAPFLAYPDRHTFVLCRTSNAGGADLQALPLAGGEAVYERVADLARAWNEPHHNVGLVVGATYPEEAARVRARCPDQLLLLPGVGAQAADLRAAVSAAVDAAGGGILVNASRAVLYAPGADYRQAARAAAEELRRAIEAART